VFNIRGVPLGGSKANYPQIKTRRYLKPRVLSTAIDLDDQTASLDVAMSVANYFELKAAEAHRIAVEVAVSVSGWREEAGRVGLTARECDRMASAFEHRDLKAALKLAV
jgi:serine/threonine-protein kinase HipA